MLHVDLFIPEFTYIHSEWLNFILSFIPDMKVCFRSGHSVLLLSLARPKFFHSHPPGDSFARTTAGLRARPAPALGSVPSPYTANSDQARDRPDPTLTHTQGSARPGLIARLALCSARPAYFTHTQPMHAGLLDYTASQGPDGPVRPPALRSTAHALAAHFTLTAPRSPSPTCSQ